MVLLLVKKEKEGAEKKFHFAVCLVNQEER